MPYISLEFLIDAPIQRCFDLSRSVDVHKYSLSHTGEEAIAGVTSGLMELGDEVTWKARHLGIVQTLSSRITEYDRPYSFRDSMVPGSGAFSRFDHDHIFAVTEDGKTKVTDVFDWDSPLGLLGKLADMLFVESHMTKILTMRNKAIKELAESDGWRSLLSPNDFGELS